MMALVAVLLNRRLIPLPVTYAKVVMILQCGSQLYCPLIIPRPPIPVCVVTTTRQQWVRGPYTRSVVICVKPVISPQVS